MCWRDDLNYVARENKTLFAFLAGEALNSILPVSSFLPGLENVSVAIPFFFKSYYKWVSDSERRNLF